MPGLGAGEYGSTLGVPRLGMRTGTSRGDWRRQGTGGSVGYMRHRVPSAAGATGNRTSWGTGAMRGWRIPPGARDQDRPRGAARVGRGGTGRAGGTTGRALTGLHDHVAPGGPHAPDPPRARLQPPRTGARARLPRSLLRAETEDEPRAARGRHGETGWGGGTGRRHRGRCGGGGRDRGRAVVQEQL